MFLLFILWFGPNPWNLSPDALGLNDFGFLLFGTWSHEHKRTHIWTHICLRRRRRRHCQFCMLDCVFEIACLHILLNGCVHPYNVWSCSASLLTEYSWNMRNTERTETHTIISLSFSIVKNWMVYRWPCRLCYLFPKRAGSIPSHISIKKFQTTHGHCDLSHHHVHLQLRKR